MYKAEYYDFSGNEGKRIKEDLKNWGFHHLTISRLPADFFRMSKSQLEKLFEHASDAFIARMYDVPEQQIQNRRDDFGIKQLTNTLNRMEREDETVQVFKEILRIVSNEYNNGNIPHTNSTPLNREKEFLYMKATGIVRRIDDLGRVVIPKEIRRTMRIREGSPLEIYTGASGEVIFKKYSPVGELSNFAGDYVEAIARSSELTAAICDEDSFIAAAGPLKRELAGREISEKLRGLIKERVRYSGGNDRLPAVESSDLIVAAAFPIISHGDVSGAVVLVSGGQTAGEADIKLTATAADFLGRQMED